MALDPTLLNILACPQCKGPIRPTRPGDGRKDDGLICEACRVCYPIRDDIPVLLIEEAVPLP